MACARTLLSVFSLVPDLLFDCSCVLEYAKLQTVLQSIGMSVKQIKLGVHIETDPLAGTASVKSTKSLKS